MIRPYLPKDRLACISIFKSNCPKYFNASELEGFKVWLDGQDQGKLAYGNSEAENYFVVLIKERIVGCGGYYIKTENLEARMAWGMIHSDYHLKGSGKSLFQFRLEDIANKYPNSGISLDTSQHTFRFFERLGFEVNEIIPNGFGPGLDQYEMKYKTR